MTRNIRLKDNAPSLCGLSRNKIYQIEPIPFQHTLNSSYLTLANQTLDSPYIIKYYKIKHLQKQDLVYSIQEKTKGTTMDQLMRHGCPSYEVIKEMIFKILKGFEVIHDGGILHRDICMNNIFVEFTFPFFTPKITSFNLFRPVYNKSLMLVSNLKYMAPEIKNYADYDIRSEIWSIGALVYDILCTKFQPGFDTGLNRIFSDSPQEINLKIIPYCFRNFIQVAMEDNPSKRPESLTELIEVLHQCLDAREKAIYNAIG
ncbi:protein kinase [Fulvivirga ulvae]|uniref:protein kinase domain-containing protein n=1 Tax=Fulvivirga ulvae TaxID=2904245 RepID=UPI001F37D73D|nr:protein kinase [Fulvivirga ulvae]UII34862.1 protein kinase [Fulvivirga ulvae]